MKICGIICEFNPFHNGHAYILEEARRLSGCDALVCIMSGSFTQRGDICIVDKYLRATHAVKGGADCVIELPAAFAVAPAEIFASGAVKILSSIPDLDTLAFGCESGSDSDFISAAKLLLTESDAFKSALRRKLDECESYIKSYAFAFESVGGNAELLSKPNNTLGVEYAKAVLRNGKAVRLLPVKRVGSGYNDGELKENFSSASAIRNNLSSHLIKSNMPDYSINDLADFSVENERFYSFMRLILSRSSPEKLTQVYGCTDGLENSLKNLQYLPFDEIVRSATSKRFTTSRIKRILCANFLDLYSSDCEKFLNTDLYLSPLAVSKKNADKVLSALAKSAYPVLTCGSDEMKLNEIAKACKEKDDFAYMQWQQIAGKNLKSKMLSV